MPTPQLTILTAPRPFEGIFERIQSNALTSWASLEPTPQVIVVGSESGTEEACSRLGLDWVPDVAVTATGVPMLDSVLEVGRAHTKADLMAYINPDVIVLQDFVDAIRSCRSRFGRFVIAAAPRNVEVDLRLSGRRQSWVEEIVALGLRAAPPKLGADVFVFPSDVLSPVPSVTVGGLGWDNWLLWTAAMSDVPFVDATNGATFIHQDHGDSTHRGSVKDTQKAFSAETRQNLRALRWWERMARRTDATYVLTKQRHIRRARVSGKAGVLMRVIGRWIRGWLRPVVGRWVLTRPLTRLYRDD